MVHWKERLLIEFRKDQTELMNGARSQGPWRRTFLMAWMELESIMLSEISQMVREQKPYDLTFNWNIINKRKKQTKYNQRH